MCMLETYLAVVVERLGHCARIQLRQRALRRWVENEHSLDEEARGGGHDSGQWRDKYDMGAYDRTNILFAIGGI